MVAISNFGIILVVEQTQVERTINLASRRRLLVQATEQLGLAISLMLGGAILLLLFGTSVLNWYWPLLFFASGLAVAIVRLRARMIEKYRVAQLLDHKLSLSDTLSTAQYLLTSFSRNEDEAIRYQLNQAEEVARSVKIEQAFPFQAHRVWAIAAALAGISFGLFALRYLVTNSLSVRAPLISFEIAPVIERIEQVLGQKGNTNSKSITHDPGQAAQAQSEASLPGVKPELPSQSPNLTSERQGSNGDAQSQAMGRGEKAGEQERTEPRDGNSASAQGQSGEKTRGESEPTAGTRPGTDPKEQGGKEGNGSPGLINRMKDALSSLAAKMQSNSGPQHQQSPSNSESPSNDKQNGQQASGASRDQQGAQQQEGKGQQSDQSQSAEGQGQGQTAEKTQAAQGHTSDQSPQKGADSHSGIGRQDGDKGIKDAEQLKAMGKLADIIGKRAANLTGEMTVETSSGSQQLKTQYSQRRGQHSDAGGEINRNEVPLMYQRYVREYMDQVRKMDKSSQ